MEAKGHTDVQSIYSERKTCRACDTKTLINVLDLGVQFLPRFPENQDEDLPKAPLHLVRCAQCGLLQLLHSVDPDLLYREFWYRSSVNQTMRDALSDLVDRTLEFQNEGTWLDIGANDGYLLSRVPEHFKRIACEPAANFEAQLSEHAHTVVSDYFSFEAIRDKFDGDCDVITSAACFYDVSDPSRFVGDVARLLSPKGVWVSQLNDSPTMLRKNAFDSICHEHVCYYDVPTLDRMYRDAGLQIVGLTYNDVNGGSVRIFASRKGARAPAELTGVPSARQLECERFALRTRRWKEFLGGLLESRPLRQEPIWCYGASTKGGTLLQYLDSDKSFLACADRNPTKWGRRMVGSWMPITDEKTMRRSHPGYVMVLPWAFRPEFLEREADLRNSGTTFIFPLPNVEFCP